MTIPMSPDIKKNNLHYYVDLLRMDGKQRDLEQSETCVTALQNVLQTMKLSRHNKICGEDFTRLNFGNIPLNGIYFSMDGKYPCRFDGCNLNEWNFMSGHSDGVASIAWSLDEKYILTVSYDETAILWDVETGLMIRKFKEVSSAIFLSDKECLLTFLDGSMIVWNLEKKSSNSSNIHTGTFGSDIISISNDRRYGLIFSSKEEKAVLVDLESGKDLWYVNDFYFGKNHFNFLEDLNSCFLYNKWEGLLEIINIESGDRIETLELFHALCFSDDGKTYLTRSYYYDDNQKYIAEIRGIKSEIVFNTFVCDSDILKAEFSHNGQYCFTIHQNGEGRIWDIDSGICLRIINVNGNIGELDSVVFSNLGEYCLICDDINTKMFDIRSNTFVKLFENYVFHTLKLAFSYDGNYCLVRPDTEINTVRIINIETGESKKLFEFDYWNPVQTVAFSVDGNSCFLGAYNGIAILCDTESGEIIKEFEAPQKGNSIWFFPYLVFCQNGICNIFEFNYLKNDCTHSVYELVSSFYNLNGLYIRNCSFHNITTNESTRKILYQYGGDIEKPEQ